LYVQVCGSNLINKVIWREVEECDGAPYISAIRSGNIYRITTSDPVKYPLPSYELLGVQHALHRVLGSLKAAGWIKEIFHGNPPDVDPVPSDSPALDPVPRDPLNLEQSLLTYLLKEAEELLTTEEADKWRGAILLAEYANLERDVERLENLGWDVPEIPPFSEWLPAEDPDEDNDGYDTAEESD
jgi:hypothetical protein